MREPRVTLMELREYTSQSGSTYFAGFLGKTRVVMLRDDRAECTGKEVARWNVLLEEAQPRAVARNAPDGRTRSAPGSSPPRRTRAAASAASRGSGAAADRRAAACLRAQGLDPVGPDPSDPLPF